LEKIYKENFNLGYLQEGNALANLYGDDFIESILIELKINIPSETLITKIGAGRWFY